MRILSGIQPPGRSISATTRAAFASTPRPRSSARPFFCIVDLHSITVDYDPADLRERTLDLAALLYATGLDPARSTVFVQSHVTAHAEAAWLLSGVASYGQLGRMTQFKDKGEGKDFIAAGLFTYPILMAGDILLYQATASRSATTSASTSSSPATSRAASTRASARRSSCRKASTPRSGHA